MKTIYIVSDLHIGDGRQPKSSRDNFMYKDKRAKFEAFLGQVKREKAELLIMGDLFDFWLADVDRVLQRNWPLLDLLADMENLVYIPGNHDGDFAGFYTPGGAPRAFLNHPFFQNPERVKRTHERTLGGTRFVFRHGHEGDAFNDADYPVAGRMVTILAGLVEDRMSRYVDYDGAQAIPVEPALAAMGDVVLWLLEPVMESLRSLRRARSDAAPSPEEDALPDSALGRSLARAEEAGLQEYENRLRLQHGALNALFDHLAGSAASGPSALRGLDASAGADMSGGWFRDAIRKALLKSFGEWLDRHGKSGDRVAAHLRAMYTGIWSALPDRERAVMVVGHTHLPGFCRDSPNGSDRVWYHNSGSWSDLDHDVLTLDESGAIRYHTWTENGLESKPPREFTDFLKVAPA